MRIYGKSDYTKINAETWDEWAKDGCDWTIPITHEEFLAAKAGACNVYLTPCRYVPAAWFGRLRGKKLLGLASGGAQPLPFADNSFDIIFHPVSNCCIREVEPVWRECFRILKPGGQLRAGFALCDLYEDRDREGCGVLREFAPQYMATLAIKPC